MFRCAECLQFRMLEATCRGQGLFLLIQLSLYLKGGYRNISLHNLPDVLLRSEFVFLRFTQISALVC
jgi:hypothetical protein